VAALAKEAAAAGFGWKTMTRAKDALGVDSAKDGMSGGWVWHPPAIAEEDKEPLDDEEDTPENAEEDNGDDEDVFFEEDN